MTVIKHKIDKDMVEYLDTEFNVSVRWVPSNPDHIALLYKQDGKVKQITIHLQGLCNVLEVADKDRRRQHYIQGAGLDEVYTEVVDFGRYTDHED